jgi:hypothetical protein
MGEVKISRRVTFDPKKLNVGPYKGKGKGTLGGGSLSFLNLITIYSFLFHFLF